MNPPSCVIPRRFDAIRRRDSDPRSLDEIRAHYEIERALSDRLRHSSREERRSLYGQLYDEAYRRIPRHPTHKADPARRSRSLSNQLGLLRPFLRPALSFLEIGPGSGCSLSLAVAKEVRSVVALDVSAEIAASAEYPPNFSLRIFDGIAIDLPPASIDLAYSNQVMEHLHPEDAFDQLRGIQRALVAGGAYVITVPNRLSGPADVSKYFDEEATGFHLREYTYRELGRMLGDAGFSRCRPLIGGRGRHISTPLTPLVRFEATLEALPKAWGRAIARRAPARNLLSIKLVAVK